MTIIALMMCIIITYFAWYALKAGIIGIITCIGELVDKVGKKGA